MARVKLSVSVSLEQAQFLKRCDLSPSRVLSRALNLEIEKQKAAGRFAVSKGSY